MKRIPGLFILFIVMLSCNLNKDRKLSAEEQQALAKAHNDSIAIIVDSFRKTNIFVPPLYDKAVFDSATTVEFFNLAKSTNGELKLLVNSQLISNEIIDIIKTYSEDNSDLLLLIDKTGSMSDDIENVQKGLSQVIKTIQEHRNIRLGIALYGDKNTDGPGWFSFRNFETNYAGARAFINDIDVTDGGDYPESVYDGFFKACDQDFWKSGNKRMIILVGDAPPLEKPLSNYTVSDVISKANSSGITMNFYPIVVTPVLDDLGKDPEAIKTYEKEKIISNIFPNPATTTVSVDFTRPGSYTIEVFNTAGNLVLKENFSGSTWKKDIGSFTNGAYIIRAIREDKKFEAGKFIVYK